MNYLIQLLNSYNKLNCCLSPLNEDTKEYTSVMQNFANEYNNLGKALGQAPSVTFQTPSAKQATLTPIPNFGIKVTFDDKNIFSVNQSGIFN